MMIQPASEHNKQIVTKSHRQMWIYYYYCFAFSLQFINFVPGIVEGGGHAKIPWDALYLFMTSTILSIPPLVELILDVSVKAIFKVHHHHVIEHDFGHAVLLLSLSLPVILVIGSLKNVFSPLFANCFIDCCQGIAVTAIYGKLQVFSAGRWTVKMVFSILILLTVGQLSLNQGVASCNDEEHCIIPVVNIAVSILLTFICLILHVSYSRKCLREVYRLIFTTKGTTFFTSNNITCTIMVFIIIIYFSLRIVLQCGYLRRHTDSMSRVLIARICVHMFLASVAAILPARAIRSMLVAMKHEMETKKTFIRYISHEIRSPLSTACLGLDYLIDQMTSHKLSYDSALEVVRDTKIAAEIATSTLNDLLMFDKIETGMLEVSTAECDMWEFVNQCVKPFNLQATSESISLKCQLADDQTEISSDRRAESDIESQMQRSEQREIFANIDKYKMEQVVRNFLTNALKFTPKAGHITVNVSVRDSFTKSSVAVSPSAKRRAENLEVSNRSVVRVEVVDSGPGISAENLPKLFGQYVQFDANTLQGGKGSGLGLWLSKAIVEMHGGVIGATSDGPGKGCRFYLELPTSQLNALGINSFSQDDADSPGASPTKLDSTSVFSDSALTVSSVAFSASDSRVVERLSLLNPSPLTVPTCDEPPLRLMELINKITSPRTPSPKGESTPGVSAFRGDMGMTTPGGTMRKALALAVGMKSKQYEVLASQANPHPHPHPHKVRRTGTHPSKLSRTPTASKDLTVYLKNLKVLLVDDSSLSRKMVERTLHELDGCVCHHAQNGLEAVQKVTESLAIPDISDDCSKNTPYDVILMDYYMPVMSGPEAVHLIRQQGYRGVVLAVTGVTSESEFNALVGRGVDRILVKPFSLEAFKQAMYDFR